ncbi:MAG TPA: hypothetical protein PKD61_24610, partial [Polyangiaceae bacterium]|nr:hypothetical protein [Polyangiaceae bacterium]
LIYLAVSLAIAGGVTYAVRILDRAKAADRQSAAGGLAYRIRATGLGERACVTERLTRADFDVSPKGTDALDVYLKPERASMSPRVVQEIVHGASTACGTKVIQTFDVSAWIPVPRSSPE